LQVLLVAVLVGIVAGAVIGRRVLHPVASIQHGLGKFALRDFSTPIDDRGPSEFGHIARSANAMAAELTATQATERDLIAGIAHDLAHPITAMRGTLEGLRDGLVDATDPSYLSRLLDAVGAMQATVDDLRDVAAYRAGRLRLERHSIDAAGLVERLGSMYRDIALRRGIKLQIAREDHIAVVTDGRRLERLLANLIVNALQATPPGGQVQLAVRSVARDTAIISVEDDAGALAFERLSATFHTASGTGLGLRVVAAIAEALEARVSVVPTAAGSRVDVALPSIASPHKADTIVAR
jgi:signal transduction histidine kinase